MKKFLEYLITSIIGAAIVVTVVCVQRIWTRELVAQMGALSDAFLRRACL